MTESLRKQVDRLAQFILDADAGYPNRSAGAIDTAMDWITDLRAEVERLRDVVSARDAALVAHPAPTEDGDR